MGTCASGLICLDGVCKTASADCADPVYPDGLCYSADVGVRQRVEWNIRTSHIELPGLQSGARFIFQRTVATCCGATYCMKPTDNADSFCMDFAIAENLPCGDTQAEVSRARERTAVSLFAGIQGILCFGPQLPQRSLVILFLQLFS